VVALRCLHSAWRRQRQICDRVAEVRSFRLEQADPTPLLPDLTSSGARQLPHPLGEVWSTRIASA
jgi:hypothetical protein